MKVTKLNGDVIECTTEEYRELEGYGKVVIASTPKGHSAFYDEIKETYGLGTLADSAGNMPLPAVMKTPEPKIRHHKIWTPEELCNLRDSVSGKRKIPMKKLMKTLKRTDRAIYIMIHRLKIADVHRKRKHYRKVGE